MIYDFDKYPSGETVVINNFPCRIGEIINTGTDGRVFTAYYGGSAAPTVVKYFKCQYNDGLLQSALKEIEALERLSNCPNAVNMIGYCVRKRADDAIEVFILMPKLVSCEELYRQGNLNTADILKMAADICDFLKFIDRRKMVHCDIKPSNIFLNGKTWQMGDFGCMQLRGRCVRSGSAAYRSPEAASNERVDIRSDMYSLGIAVYRLLSGGRFPFCKNSADKMSKQEIVNAIDRRLAGEPIDDTEVANPEINELLMEMCAFDKKLRPRSSEAVKKRIMKILSRL